MGQIVYLDNAATTALCKNARDKMLEVMDASYGNASSIYSLGRQSKVILEDARNNIAKCLNCKNTEVFFTGSGSEADNWAIIGYATTNKRKGNHIITTKIEHHAVLHSCEYLEKNGFSVTYLDVDEYGLIDPAELEKAITPQTVLITVMYANNEVGTIEPIREIAEIAKNHKICFHTDAVQAVGSEKIDFQELGADMLSLSAHKFHGPKGAGCLIIKKGTIISPYIFGGAQESGKRAGTENLAAIAGMSAALSDALDDIDNKQAKIKELREYLKEQIVKNIPHIKFNGHPQKRLNNNVNFCFEFIEGESLLLMLDMAGICGSSGSACTSGSLDPSHVLLALGLPHEIAHGSLRLTLSDLTTKEELDYTVARIEEIAGKLRLMSPLYSD